MLLSVFWLPLSFTDTDAVAPLQEIQPRHVLLRSSGGENHRSRRLRSRHRPHLPLCRRCFLRLSKMHTLEYVLPRHLIAEKRHGIANVTTTVSMATTPLNEWRDEPARPWIEK